MKTNRRHLVTVAGAGVVALGLGQIASAQTTALFASGGLGLTRSQLEETLGPGEQVEMPGHPIYDSTYAYGTQLGMFSVWYMEANGDAYAAYIEINFASDNLDSSEARKHAERMMPTDARFTELYVAPATPNGPLAIEMTRYVSESLGKIHSGVFAPEIVVMIQQPWDDSNQGTPASSVSIMARMVTQAG